MCLLGEKFLGKTRELARPNGGLKVEGLMPITTYVAKFIIRFLRAFHNTSPLEESTKDEEDGVKRSSVFSVFHPRGLCCRELDYHCHGYHGSSGEAVWKGLLLFPGRHCNSAQRSGPSDHQLPEQIRQSDVESNLRGSLRLTKANYSVINSRYFWLFSSTSWYSTCLTDRRSDQACHCYQTSQFLAFPASRDWGLFVSKFAALLDR
ncbi:hypothetical protein RRG08_020486 [Elysia crispata]|uniref:Uncharacterized protein n=1 Tax=Elysia crispata TaxID=231223 RepID=A0AAE0ZGQ0_9GAST|nr:hypothetical protein RRG08_020486 [Elysia crispata]